MSEVTVNVGVVSIPESRIKKIVCWIPKKLADTQGIEARISNIESNISNMQKHMGAMNRYFERHSCRY